MIAFVASVGFPFAASAVNISIGTVSPTEPTSNVAVTLSASVSAAAGIQYCHLYVESEDVGDMTIFGSTASRSYTFTRGGVHTAFVFCKDNANAMAAGPNTSINVQGALVNTAPLSSQGYSSPEPASPPATQTQTPAPAQTQVQAPVVPPAGAPAFGSLVKLACAADASTDDPCKAVYYYGSDGKRHAFPNSKVYFTWYQNFDAVVTVEPTVMGEMPLGKNVTYRPGVRMVKFTTVNTVYAVGADGVLRWVKSEDVARSLYGADWNTKIDDISDVFYTNYTFGADVNAATEFSAETETAAATDIDHDLN